MVNIMYCAFFFPMVNIMYCASLIKIARIKASPESNWQLSCCLIPVAGIWGAQSADELSSNVGYLLAK
jgi:hypothetical protein